MSTFSIPTMKPNAVKETFKINFFQQTRDWRSAFACSRALEVVHVPMGPKQYSGDKNSGQILN